MVPETLKNLSESIQQAQIHSPAAQHPLTLIAVSKQQPLQRIEEALESGIRDFGENRVQEAADKWPPLRQRYPDLRLHMIGGLQSNKVEQMVDLFDVFHSLDRPKLADRLAEALDKIGKKMPCFIQVNTGDESQKSGLPLKEADSFIRYCREQTPLDIVGLMCIPPTDELAAPHFALLHKIASEHGLKHLSMGMSGDYLDAVRLGATHIRLGTALFGSRM